MITCIKYLEKKYFNYYLYVCMSQENITKLAQTCFMYLTDYASTIFSPL